MPYLLASLFHWVTVHCGTSSYIGDSQGKVCCLDRKGTEAPERKSGRFIPSECLAEICSDE